MPQFENPNKTAPEGATPRKIIRSAEEAWEARQEPFEEIKMRRRFDHFRRKRDEAF